MATQLDIEQLKREAARVFAGRGVHFAYLHGSQADGTATDRSDVDLAIMTDALSSVERLKLELALEVELAKQMPGVSFDVRSLNEAPLPFRGRVVQQGQVVFCLDDPERVDFEGLTRKLYFDFRPTLEAHQAAYIRRHAATERDDYASRP